MGVGGCMSVLYSGLWLVIFQFISLSVTGAVKEKPKGLNGRSWMGGPAGASRNTFFYLFVSQRAHLLLTDGRRILVAGRVPSPWPHRGLVKHSTNWKCQVCHNDSEIHMQGFGAICYSFMIHGPASLKGIPWWSSSKWRMVYTSSYIFTPDFECRRYISCTNILDANTWTWLLNGALLSRGLKIFVTHHIRPMYFQLNSFLFK